MNERVQLIPSAATSVLGLLMMFSETFHVLLQIVGFLAVLAGLVNIVVRLHWDRQDRLRTARKKPTTHKWSRDPR